MWQPILMISGYFISVLGLAMLVPAGVDIYYTQTNWSDFVTASIISLFIGLSLFLANNNKIQNITQQQGYLLTCISWFSVALLAALPFILYGTSPADAVFEAASGISTTGASIYKDVEALPRSILLWRAILNSLGGVGIVIFAIALLPFLGIGGMQIFQRENSDVNEKFMPKISYIAKRIILVYIILNLLCLSSLKLAGMGWFDAVCHALATIATGGMSTKNASVGAFNSASIDWTITLFMFLGAIPLTFYHSVWATKNLHSLRSSQVATFIKVLGFYIICVTLWLWSADIYDLPTALRQAAFNITSIVTSTGFVSCDYLKWSIFAGTLFIAFALTGGCTGSTAGSIKIFRWQVVFAYLKKALITTTEPNRLVPLKIGQSNISNEVTSSIFTFLTIYSLSIAILTLLVSICGFDFVTSFSAVIACMTNSGPGIGNIVGPSGNYSSLTDTAKYILAFAMIFGRLEVMTVVVIFTKNFWK